MNLPIGLSEILIFFGGVFCIVCVLITAGAAHIINPSDFELLQQAKEKQAEVCDAQCYCDNDNQKEDFAEGHWECAEWKGKRICLEYGDLCQTHLDSNIVCFLGCKKYSNENCSKEIWVKE